ncbi:hypothetical protein PC116_g14886 [Phytophthora cactorum]|nr:hypothetical protein PC112_g13198 [Phytophthora cactorum]KAG2898467.1 hypothetical protein PC114_g14266 [Phytophthora cactorum]KAG3077892.1 hypothetical protein PC122_g12938 [Phytophthora cactorum]KAG3195249.1 hypothetical protein PC128_g8643 [Phytophthora cactorum]KAG4057704.1 hypothetical protein PC123_g7296 [Phytophthora cactorum]
MSRYLVFAKLVWCSTHCAPSRSATWQSLAGLCSHATGSSVEGWGQEEDYCNSILEIVRACRHWAEIVTSAL